MRNLLLYPFASKYTKRVLLGLYEKPMASLRKPYGFGDEIVPLK
jgi:hypothetical protein